MAASPLSLLDCLIDAAEQHEHSTQLSILPIPRQGCKTALRVQDNGVNLISKALLFQQLQGLGQAAGLKGFTSSRS
jgi:hypothetical protein